ncbi:hypothetical protein GQ457_03G020630 [Hibiscus cannabinus]
MPRQITSRDSLPRAEMRKLKGIAFCSLLILHNICIQNSREKSVERNIYLFDIERVKLKKQVNTVHVRDQKHELTPPRDRYPCDNGYKEVTVLPSRDIVYDQAKQLFGLRHKPITQQDAMPRSNFPSRFLPRQDPLSLFEASLCHPVEAEHRSTCIEEVEALTIDSEAIID